jgi:alpha-L-rhamnosidase
VKVRSHGTTKDQAGNIAKESTDWSNPATVEAALLEHGDWTARLTTSTVIPSKSEPIRPILFRKVFTTPEHQAKISSARLHITAHGVYEAFINGQRIGDEEMAPGWTSYKHRLVYRMFDVAQSLLAGKPNVIGIEVAEGWFAGHLGMEEARCFYGDRIAILAQLEVTFENGSKYTLGSDGAWKSYYSPRTRSEIYNGEDYDSGQEQNGWNSDPDFNESSWLRTVELTFPSASIVATDSPPVRKMEEIAPIKIFRSKSGKTLLDFGQNLVGKLQVCLPLAPLEGHQISFSHAEVLERDELGTRPLRGAKPIDTVTLSKHQPKIWSPKFTFHGFRYVQIDGWPTDSGLPAGDDVTALVLYSDMARTGWFSCSEPLINKLHENVCWSMKGNFFSLPTDCPQRDERLGWTGDLQVFCPSASFIFDTKGFLGSWLDDVALEQMEEGRNGVPGLVVPDIFEKPNPPGPQCAWHDVTVLTPWDLYNSSGDQGFLRKQYASMKAWVDKGIMRGPNGLWDKNNWQYGDWLDPAAPPSEPGQGRTDSLIVGDAYLVRVLETISKVSLLLGEKEDAETYSKDALRVRQAFQYEYTTPSGLLVGDTQTALSLALCFGLYNRKDHVIQAASRLCHLVHSSRYRIATGFAGTPLITHALSDTGNHQLAYRMLLEKSCPSWLYPITMGATTIWERWDSMLPDGSINPGDMTSFNHYALGSVANWLHKNVAGISPLEPGWRTIKVRPVPGGTITSANAAYESPYGRVESSWKINDAGDTFTLEVTVPPNSEAVVILPSEWNNLADDTEEKGARIGSGKYTFSCPYVAAEWPPKAEFARSTFRLEV